MSSSDNTRAPRRGREFWQEHTDQWKRSGLSKIAYSQKHDLKPISFYSWSKKLDHIDSQLPACTATQPLFLPVQIDHSPTSMRGNPGYVHVKRAATDVALPVDLTSEQIQQWLFAIHSLHA